MLRAMLLLVALSANAVAAEEDRVGAVLSDAVFRASAWSLLARGGFGQMSTERAAFVVRRSDGALEMAEWPFQSQFCRASWSGRIPDGAIAIVHTHPNCEPEPSPDDAAVARQLAMPVFVVTRQQIAWTDGQRSQQIWLGAWSGPHDPTAIASIEQRLAARAGR